MRYFVGFIVLMVLSFSSQSCVFDDSTPEIIKLVAPENVFAGQVVPVYFEIENTSLRSIEIRRVEFNFSTAAGQIGDLNSEYAKTVVTSPAHISGNSKESYMFGFTVADSPTLSTTDYPVRVNIRVYWNIGMRNIYKNFNWAVRMPERVEDMPAARAFGSAGVIDETLYTFGGWENVTMQGHREIFEYDIDDNEWDTHSEMLPDRRIYTSSVTINDKIYILGGFDTEKSTYTNEVLVFDGNSISVDGNLSEAKAGVAVATDRTNIYVIGGKSTGDVVLGTIEKYVPAVGSTVMTSTLTEPRHSGTAGFWDEKAYILGGSTNGNSIVASAVVEEFDISTDTITQIGDLSIATAQFGSCVRDGHVYMFGGLDSFKWQGFGMQDKKPMILGRILENTYGGMSANSEDAIFHIGGWAELGNLDMVHSRVYKINME